MSLPDYLLDEDSRDICDEHEFAVPCPECRTDAAIERMEAKREEVRDADGD
jgi:hypothetical protein